MTELNFTDPDSEERRIPSALIIRDLNEAPSNFRSALPISQLLEEHDVPGICGVDTRKLVRHIRDHGSCRVLVRHICAGGSGYHPKDPGKT